MTISKASAEAECLKVLKESLGDLMSLDATTDFVIAEPLPVYTMDLSHAAEGDLERGARFRGWRYLLLDSDDGERVALADVDEGSDVSGKRQPSFNSVAEGANAQ